MRLRYIQWNERRVGRDENKNQVKLALRKGFLNIAFLEERKYSRYVADRMMIELLEAYPEMTHITTPGRLFAVATLPDPGTWLIRSGADLKSVILAGMKEEKHLHLLGPDLSLEDNPTKKWEQWLDQDPAIRQAWRSIDDESPDEVPTTDPIVIGVKHNLAWAKQAAAERDGAQRLQKQLDDPRTWKYIKPLDFKTVITWMRKEPSWRSWVNSGNYSLIDLLSHHAGDTVGKIYLNKESLTTLMKIAPDLLTKRHPDNNKRMIDLLDYHPSLKPVVWGQLLQDLTPQEQLSTLPKPKI